MDSTSLVRIPLAALFLYSSSFKLVDPRPLAATIRALGITPRPAARAARVIPVLELLVVVTLVAPLKTIPLAASLALGLAAVAIGAVGLFALRLPASIPCACFSAHSSGTLGLRQLMTAIVLASAASLLGAQPPMDDVYKSVVVLIVAIELAIAVHIATLTPVVRALAGYRRAASFVHPV